MGPVHIALTIDGVPWSVVVRSSDGVATFRCRGSYSGGALWTDDRWERIDMKAEPVGEAFRIALGPHVAYLKEHRRVP